MKFLTKKNPTVAVWEKLVYGFGEVNLILTYTPTSTFLLIYLTDIIKISPAAAAAAIFIGRMWDGINNPIMGVLSDRTRWKWGRRKPYMVIAAIPIALSMIMMWTPIGMASVSARAIYYGAAYFIFATFSTVFAVPYASLGMEMTSDYNERTSIATYKVIVGVIFGVVISVFAASIVTGSGDYVSNYKTLGLVIGVGSILPAVLVGMLCKERATIINTKKEKASFKEVMKILVGNRSLMASCSIVLTNKVAIGMSEGFQLYYLTYWLGRPELLTPFLMVGAAGWLLSTPIWSIVCKKIGKKATYILCQVIWMLGLAGFIFIGRDSSPIPCFILQFITCIGYGYAHVLPYSMIADVADVDELKSGKRREGLIAGINSMFASFGAAIYMIPITFVLTRVGYQPNVEQTGAALQAMRYIMAFGAALPLSLGLLATIWYDITPKKFKEIHELLKIKREEMLAEIDRQSAENQARLLQYCTANGINMDDPYAKRDAMRAMLREERMEMIQQHKAERNELHDVRKDERYIEREKEQIDRMIENDQKKKEKVKKNHEKKMKKLRRKD